MPGPLFERLLASGIDEETQSVTFGLLAADGKRYDMQVTVGCAPALIGALSAETGKLLAKLPKRDVPMQGIAVVGTQLAMKEDGTVALFLVLESGVELPLEFRHVDLVKLREQIDEAVQLADRKGRH